MSDSSQPDTQIPSLDPQPPSETTNAPLLNQNDSNHNNNNNNDSDLSTNDLQLNGSNNTTSSQIELIQSTPATTTTTTTPPTTEQPQQQQQQPQQQQSLRPQSAQRQSSEANIAEIYPDKTAATINITTNRSASHLFLRQKLETVRNINNLSRQQYEEQQQQQQQLLSNQNNQDNNVRPRSSSTTMRQQFAAKRSMSQYLHNTNNNDNNNIDGGNSNHNDSTHNLQPIDFYQEEFDFNHYDTNDKPMTQDEYNDLKKKKESSLDFVPPTNNLYVIDQFASTRNRRLCDGLFRWLVVIIIAIFTGLVGAALRIANTRINNYKLGYMLVEFQKLNYVGGWGIFVAWNLLFIMCSAFIVLCIEVKANGSGIPDVKAYLNGCNIRGVFTAKTLVAKTISSALTICSSLPSGLQGPTIHIGSIMGGWFATSFKMLLMRLCCCARPYEDLRDYNDIPKLPNPISAKIHQQGYFQAVYEEQIGVAQDQRHITIHDYTENDLFLQSAGVKLLPPQNTKHKYHIDSNGIIHGKPYPPRTDINAEGKPSLRLEGGDTISPALVDNFTIDDDLVPTSNTGRRKLAQFGIVIDAKSGPMDDQLANDFAKPIKNPTKFGEKVNANGGVMGLVIRDKRVRVQVDQDQNHRLIEQQQQQLQHVNDHNDNNDNNTTTNNNPNNNNNNNNNDDELSDDEAQQRQEAVIANAVNVVNLGDDRTILAQRCPRCWRSIHIPSFNTDADRSQFISIGSACGVASAMGSIIGGTLFALEEMSTHWSPFLGLKVLTGCTLSFLVCAFLTSGNNGTWGIFTSTSHTFYIGNRVAPYLIQEIPLYILTGILVGLLGSMYIFITMNIMRWRNATHGTRIWTKFIDTAIIAIIFSTLSVVIPFAWPCEIIPPDLALVQATANASTGTYGTYQFDCPAGYHNAFSDLSLVRADLAIKRMFARGVPGSYAVTELGGWFMFYFIFCSIIQQTNASFGIMVPIFIMGSTAGRFFGQLFQTWWGYTTTTATTTTIYFDPGIYAVVGAAAMFAAITRSTLSMTVVVLEMTADLNLLAPALIGAFTSHLVASHITPSLFISIINERKLPYLPHEPTSELNRMTAKQIMVPKPIVVGSCEKVSHLLEILETSIHAAYPVVLEPCTSINATTTDSNGHRGDGCDNNFLGSILRNHLIVVLNRRSWRANSTPFTKQDFERVTSRSMPKLGELRARFTAQDLNSYLDLTPWVNRSSFIVPEHMIAANVFTIFRSMGFRHLHVVNAQKHITGIITRLELLPRVVQHRWITLRQLERAFIANGGGSTLIQQYIDSNTAYNLINSHAVNTAIAAQTREAKCKAYLVLHQVEEQASNNSNNNRPDSSNNNNNNGNRPASSNNIDSDDVQLILPTFTSLKRSPSVTQDAPTIIMPSHNKSTSNLHEKF